MHRDGLQQQIAGRFLAKELAGDGSGDRIQLVIDGTDGRVHQIELRADQCDGIGRGMIVSATPPLTEARAADSNILVGRVVARAKATSLTPACPARCNHARLIASLAR